MLDDRSYMRSSPFEAQRPVTVVLLIALAVLFVLQSVVDYYTPWPMWRYFALSKEGLGNGFLWQLLTFQFMHAPLANGGILHLLLNCWAIYMFGRPVEEALGRSGFLRLYLLSGVFGGLLQMLGSVILPSHFGIAQVVGASAGAFGLVAAYASLYPERPLTLLLAFILPISMRAKFLLLFSAIFAIFGILIPTSPVAHAAHLGGLLTGLIYVRWGVQAASLLLARRPRRLRPPNRELIRMTSAKASAWRSAKSEPQELPPAEFISREVDPILEKISAHGIQSLTDQERRTLEAARAKMERR